MKKALTILAGLLICLTVDAQAYRGLNIGPPPEYVQIDSFQGISVTSLSYSQASGSYTVTLMNNNYNRTDEKNSYFFDWYLSYKGKRVSDYYSSTIFCRQTETRNKIYTWPSSVPSGHEKYVTLQFGKEKPKKDRRDDD